MPTLLERLTPVAAAAGLALLAIPALAQSASPFTSDQRRAIESIVKDYLVKNPEVLQEAIGELEKRQADAQKKAQSVALAETRETLLTSPHAIVAGNTSGDVTLVEFFDYNCGYCKRALSDVRALVKSDGKLRVILKDLPVLGPDSIEATRVALAVKQQISGEKLFEYHSRLLETRGRVGSEQALKLARDMGLDMGRIQRDLAGPEVKAALAESSELSEKLALTGTPAFVVGDEVISGAVGVEPLRQAIAMTRKCGHAVC